jgi:hypothetical protein
VPEVRSPDTMGDFQTPRDLASAVWQSLGSPEVDVLVEPTVGKGVFLSTAPATHRHLPWIAYDLNHSYVEHTRKLSLEEGLTADVRCKSIFDVSHAELNVRINGKRVLAIGKPALGNQLGAGRCRQAQSAEKAQSLRSSRPRRDDWQG